MLAHRRPRALAHADAERSAAYFELLELILTEALQQLRDERVRVGPELLRIGYIALPLRKSSDALCPPKPIEFDIDTSNGLLRATSGM